MYMKIEWFYVLDACPQWLTTYGQNIPRPVTPPQITSPEHWICPGHLAYSWTLTSRDLLHLEHLPSWLLARSLLTLGIFKRGIYPWQVSSVLLTPRQTLDSWLFTAGLVDPSLLSLPCPHSHPLVIPEARFTENLGLISNFIRDWNIAFDGWI